jgi:hypothetical protein
VTVLAVVLLIGAGHGVLRIAVGDLPHRLLGVVPTAGLSVLCGAVAIAEVTTLAGVLGLPTRLWPIVAPAVLVLCVAGLLPTLGYRHRLPARAGRWLGIDRAAVGRPTAGPQSARRTSARTADLPVFVLVTALGAVLLTGGRHWAVRSIDEWAIWATRGRGLSLAGHLDPRIFDGVAANYQHLDYPLLVPSLIAWSDGVQGRADDPAAHVLLILQLLAMLGVLGWTLTSLVGPVVGVVGVLLAAGTPDLLARWGTLLAADATLVAFAVALLGLLALWLQTERPGLLPVAAILGGGTATTKVEGLLFTLCLFVAAGVAVGRAAGQYRRLIAAGVVALLADAPWLLWTARHHLHSDQINSTTLAPDHLRGVLRFAGIATAQTIRFWPGHGWALTATAVLAAAAALAIGTGRRPVLFLAMSAAFCTLGLWAQYVISAGAGVDFATGAIGLRGHFASSAPRVLMVPAILVMLLLPLSAGLILRGPSRRQRLREMARTER